MDAFIGTKRLIRLNLRRDRITLPAIMLLAVAMAGGSAPALVSAYPTYAEQISYVASSAPSIIGRLFQGPVGGVNIGTILSAETFLTTAIILAIMSIFIISRHTRHNEETGAGELISSGVVGRSAPLTAAMIVAIGANLVTGLLLFAIIASQPEFDVYPTFLFSITLAVTGIFFAAVSAITVQLSDYRRGANALAIAFLVLAFIIRAFGDALGDIAPDGLSVASSWISWLSPLGWAFQVLPYNDNNLIPLFLLIGASIIISVIGYHLLNRRDIGSSIFQSRPGNDRAKASLLGANGLTRKLQKANFIGWSIGFILSGVMMGVVTNDFRSTFEENELFQEFLLAQSGGANFTETVFAAMFPLTIAFLSGYVVAGLGKIQDEESSGRLEYLLGTALGRIKWLMSHIGFVIFGIISNIALFGLAAASSYLIATEDAETTFTKIMTLSLITIPAMLVFMSVIMLVYALKGRFIKVFAWSYFAYIGLISSLAGIFKWPSWTDDLSPFSFVPTTAVNTDYTPVWIMSALSIIIIGISVWIFKSRDLNLK